MRAVRSRTILEAMRRTRRTLQVFLALALVVLGGLPSPLRAAASVSFDIEMLNRLLPALAPKQVDVPLAVGRSMTVQLEDLKVTGFDPAAGRGSIGYILTSVRVRAPQLGLIAPLSPRMSLQVAQVGADKFLELRFEELQLELPLGATVDLASFLAPLRFTAENISKVAGAEGDVRIHTRITDVKMGTQALRLEVDFSVLPQAER